MSSTRISRHVKAPRAIVYHALLDARAVATWMVPTGMTSHVHAFDAPGSRSPTTRRVGSARRTAENVAGWRSSLAKLAALVEAG